MKDLLEQIEEFHVIHVLGQKNRIMNGMTNLAMRINVEGKFLYKPCWAMYDTTVVEAPNLMTKQNR